jgi:hypothetical protein
MMDGPETAFPWAIAIVGGPLVLFVVLFWVWLRSRKVDDRSDPDTPSDDPSKGMTGHD